MYETFSGVTDCVAKLVAARGRLPCAMSYRGGLGKPSGLMAARYVPDVPAAEVANAGVEDLARLHATSIADQISSHEAFRSM
jgi:hypothetical protein